MNFELIDDQLAMWVKQNNLFLYTKHPEGEVRAIDISNAMGVKAQIGIEVYSKIKIIIGASNLDKKRIEYRTSIKNFTQDLDEVYKIIMENWLTETD